MRTWGLIAVLIMVQALLLRYCLPLAGKSELSKVHLSFWQGLGVVSAVDIVIYFLAIRSFRR